MNEVEHDNPTHEINVDDNADGCVAAESSSTQSNDSAATAKTRCLYLTRKGIQCKRRIVGDYCAAHRDKQLNPTCSGKDCVRSTRAKNGYCTRCPDGIAAHKTDFRNYVRNIRLTVADSVISQENE